eukprot:Partr_v1_DN28073_c2_g1_i1_m57424 putative HPP family
METDIALTNNISGTDQPEPCIESPGFTWRTMVEKILLQRQPHPRDTHPKFTAAYPWPEPWPNYLGCFIGIFTGVSILAYLTQHAAEMGYTNRVYYLGSFGASCVLFFATPNSQLAQPKNALLSQPMAAIIGITLRIIIPKEIRWLGIALSVSITTVLMMILHILHPPAGATALISASLPVLPEMLGGYIYVLLPVAVGDLMLFGLAL